ncbi:hypothetical protein BCEN4_10010 [Burkholderia cenocepacia]|nr:hypothetical protein BCEN4_10010 [Burkholderia cenocepacia]
MNRPFRVSIGLPRKSSSKYFHLILDSTSRASPRLELTPLRYRSSLILPPFVMIIPLLFQCPKYWLLDGDFPSLKE